MVTRLPLVLAQSDRPLATGEITDEDILAHFLFEKGVDPTIVSDLDRIALDDTSHLCLTGIAGPFILLSRAEAAHVASLLRKFEIPGRLFEHHLVTNDQPMLHELSHDARSIHFVRLTPALKLSDVASLAHRILRESTIQVFSLQGVKPIAKSQRAESDLPIVAKPNAPISNSTPNQSSLPATAHNVNPTIVPSVDDEAVSDATDAELDHLLDALDDSNV